MVDLAVKIQELSRTDFAKHLTPLWEDDLDTAYEAIRTRCAKDFELFCQVFFGHYIQYPFNAFHRDCFAFYASNPVAARRVDCAPRGYAKSTIKSLFKPLHDIAYGLEKYILFISATQRQAIGKLKDVRAEILDNALFYNTYGIQFPSKRVGTEGFEVYTPTGTILLQTVSAGTEIRGLRFRENRPTKIILDDVEDSEEVYNEEIREKTRAWFREVVSQMGSDRTHIEVVGTVLHRDSLLMTLKKNPAYTTKVYKAVISWSPKQDLWRAWKKIYTNLDNDSRKEEAQAYFEANKIELVKDTEVLWPEKESYLTLMKEMVEIGHRAFMKEKQNQPLPSGEALFDNIWWYYEDTQNGIPGVVVERTGGFVPFVDMEAYGAIDPATGESKSKNKRGLDYTCIASGYKDLKGRLFLHRDWTNKAKPTRYIREIFEHNDIMQYNKFAIETNLYRGLLIENIQRERRILEADRKKRGVEDWAIKVPFYEIENREKKEKRIYTLEPKVNNGWILFNRSLSMDFMTMIEEFPKGDHDDAPDALEMLWGVVNNRYTAVALDLNVLGSR